MDIRTRLPFALIFVLVLSIGMIGCAQQGGVQESKETTGQVPPQPQQRAAKMDDSSKPRVGGGVEAPPQGQGRQFRFGADQQLRDVNFDFDRAVLTEQARQIVRQNANMLKQDSAVKLQIEGHADERGTAEYNLGLGDRRAESVRQYLVQLGIPADRIFTISYGEERPADPSHNEDAWAKNRRAHFLVTAR